MRSTRLVGQTLRIFCTVCFLLVGASSAVRAESGPGNGGDTDAILFATIIQNVIEAQESVFSWSPMTSLEMREIFRMKNHASRMQVILVHDEPVLGPDGKPRDAVSDPETGVIRVDYGRWQTKNRSVDRRVALALHEFFVIAGLEKSDSYSKSKRTLSNLASFGYTVAHLGAMNMTDPLKGDWYCVNGKNSFTLDVSRSKDYHYNADWKDSWGITRNSLPVSLFYRGSFVRSRDGQNDQFSGRFLLNVVDGDATVNEFRTKNLMGRFSLKPIRSGVLELTMSNLYRKWVSHIDGGICYVVDPRDSPFASYSPDECRVYWLASQMTSPYRCTK